MAQAATAVNETTATIIEASAFILGFKPMRTVENIFIGSVVASGPATKLEITTSSNERVKANSQPDTRAGIIIGKVITKNIFNRFAPKSMAASSSDLSSSANRDEMMTVTKAIVKVTWAIQIDTMPFGETPKGANKVTNINSSASPVTTSGITRGAVINAPNKVLPRKTWKRVMTKAANVPSTTAAVAEVKAILRLTQAAFSMESSFIKATYHLNEKPDQEVDKRDSLNEKTTSNNMGKYRNRNPRPRKLRPNQLTLWEELMLSGPLTLSADTCEK